MKLALGGWAARLNTSAGGRKWTDLPARLWPFRSFRNGRLIRLGDLRAMPLARLQNAIRSTTHVVFLGNNKILCRVLGRYKLYLDTNDAGLAPHLMLDGFWKTSLVQFMARHLQAGMTVVDVGANAGYYSLLMSELVSGKGRCFSIEANPSVSENLQASLILNGFGQRSTVAKYALGGGGQSEVRFFIPYSEHRNARIIGPGESADWSKGRTVSVPCSSLDAICAGVARVDFIRMDARGAEPEIFRGMNALLTRDHPDIIMEFNYRRIPKADQFLAGVQSHYPVLRHLDPSGRLRPISADRLAKEKPGVDRLLFLSNRKNL